VNIISVICDSVKLNLSVCLSAVMC